MKKPIFMSIFFPYKTTQIIFTLLQFMLILFSMEKCFAQPEQNHIHEAKEFIIDKFKNYDVVAIGEVHDKKEVTDFYINLIQSESFRKEVDFIVIEIGNHLYQEVLDDYTNGKEIGSKGLKRLWRDHTCSPLNSSDNTGLIRLLRSVRNENLKSKFKLNVIAADPAIDWQRIECLQQYFEYLGQRDEHYFTIVDELVVEKSKKALLIMGNSHFNKMRTASMIENNSYNPIHYLSKKMEIFLINILSTSSFPFHNFKEVEPGYLVETTDLWLANLRIGTPFIKTFTLKEQTDAILYLGKASELNREDITPFNDEEYQVELNRRINLIGCQ